MCHYFPADTQYLRINRHFDRNDQQETKERARANHVNGPGLQTTDLN